MATIYIAQTAQGSDTGVDEANAHSAAWFNTEGNWGSGAGKINPGDTPILTGSISTQLTVQASGLPGLVTTILWAPGAKLTRTAGTLISCTGKSYIKFDGGTNGIIENTANGSALANKVAASGLDASGCSNIEICNLTFQNLYVHSSLADTTVDIGTCGGVYLNTFGSNISIHDCDFSDVGWALNFQSGSSASGITIYNNDFENYDHGIGGFSGVTGAEIYGNHFGSTANWDTTANAYHHDGIHFYFGATGSISGVSIYGNRFDGDWGTNNTGYVFIEGDYTHTNPDAVSDIRIYNNLLIAEGAVGGMIGGYGPNWIVANNTAIGAGVVNSEAFSVGGSNLRFENNLITGFTTFVRIASGTTFAEIDNNLYADQIAGGNAAWYFGASTYGTLANWRTATSGEAESILSDDAALDVDGAPQSGSPAIDAGTDLSAYFTTDYNGAPRNDPWDIGAIRYVNSMADNLTLNQTANTDPVVEVWYERNVGTGSFAHVVRRHSGPYPSQPVNGYERPVAWGKNNAWVYVFRDEGQDDETFIADSLS